VNLLVNNKIFNKNYFFPNVIVLAALAASVPACDVTMQWRHCWMTSRPHRQTHSNTHTEFFECINSKISLKCCTETGAVYQNALDGERRMAHAQTDKSDKHIISTIHYDHLAQIKILESKIYMQDLSMLIAQLDTRTYDGSSKPLTHNLQRHMTKYRINKWA